MLRGSSRENTVDQPEKNDPNLTTKLPGKQNNMKMSAIYRIIYIIKGTGYRRNREVIIELE